MMLSDRQSIRLSVLVGLVLVAVSSLLAIGAGPVALTPSSVLQALRGLGDPTHIAIVRDLRAPRVALALLVGAGLSASGGALQGTLRNALAEPYLLGVSGGAAIGAVLASAFGNLDPVLVTLSAFVGAGLCTLLVSAIARVVGGSTDARMLLMAGVVVGAFANAVILVALADAPPEHIRSALWWMMGSVGDATWDADGRVLLALVLFGGLLLWWARDLDVLATGEDAAAALGLDVTRASRRIFLIASWLAAATVASAGLIGFVGLVVPNLARALGARRHRPMLVVSMIYGAALLVLADLAARTVRAPSELPLGAVTALIGVPFFLLRLRRLNA